MRPDDPEKVVYELATEITELDAHRLQIKLRDGITFHDGKPFTAEDVKATFEYGAQLDRPKQVYPGGPDTFAVETPDDHTVIVDTSKGGYGASLFIFLASYLPILSAKDVAEGPKGPASGAAVGGASFDDSTRGERAKVLDLIAETAPMTLQLALLAMVFALMIGVPIGVWGGLYPGRLPDRLALYTSSLFVSLPNFWLGIVLALLLSVKLNLLPAIGYKGFSYTILPALVLAVEIAPFIIRTLTVSVAGVMGQSFIDIARVRGLSRNQIVFRHALKNSAVPLLNLLGVQFSMLLGGVLVIEFIFDYPGL
ncbi:ABC transporter permease subunit, partial [Cereibacter sphaeroides]